MPAGNARNRAADERKPTPIREGVEDRGGSAEAISRVWRRSHTRCKRVDQPPHPFGSGDTNRVKHLRWPRKAACFTTPSRCPGSSSVRLLHAPATYSHARPPGTPDGDGYTAFRRATGPECPRMVEKRLSSELQAVIVNGAGTGPPGRWSSLGHLPVKRRDHATAAGD
jgi:hypothetical protein